MQVKMPRSLEKLIPLIGEEGVVALILHCRRSSRSWRWLYVPYNLHEAHPLVKTLGWQRAEALSEAFGGDRLMIVSGVGSGRSRKKALAQTA